MQKACHHGVSRAHRIHNLSSGRSAVKNPAIRCYADSTVSPK